MSQHIDAIYDGGVFRPVEPFILPEGTKVHLYVEAETASGSVPSQVRSPRLAHPDQINDFQMEIGEARDAVL